MKPNLVTSHTNQIYLSSLIYLVCDYGLWRQSVVKYRIRSVVFKTFLENAFHAISGYTSTSLCYLAPCGSGPSAKVVFKTFLSHTANIGFRHNFLSIEVQHSLCYLELISTFLELANSAFGTGEQCFSATVFAEILVHGIIPEQSVSI